MRGSSLSQIYQQLVELGVVRSKRHFAKAYLNRGKTYLRDFEQRCRYDVEVSVVTVLALRNQLEQLIHLLPPYVASEIKSIVIGIDVDDAVHQGVLLRSDVLTSFG